MVPRMIDPTGVHPHRQERAHLITVIQSVANGRSQRHREPSSRRESGMALVPAIRPARRQIRALSAADEDVQSWRILCPQLHVGTRGFSGDPPLTLR